MNEVDKADLWMADNWQQIQKYGGKWVAVSGNGIAGVAETLKELANQKTVDLKKMIVMRAPTIEESNSIWVLSQNVGK